MRKILLIIFMLLAIIVFSCKEEVQENTVEMEQIDIDQSTDYKYIFRERIEEEKKLEEKKKEKDFFE